MRRSGDKGFHKSIDGGASWTTLTIGGISDANISDAVMDEGVLIIFVGLQNVGVFVTFDLGATWRSISNGPPQADWIKLAIGSRKVLAKMGPDTGLLFVSGGGTGYTSWTAIPWDYEPAPNQKTWTSFIETIPGGGGTREVILGGGVDLWRSEDGGTSFTQITGTHLDHHAIVFSPTDFNVCYMATDGGVYKSINKGQTWTLSSNGLVCTQLYVSDVAQTSPFIIGGGTQDQGFIKSDGSAEWVDTNAGNEGNVFIIDPNDSHNIYVDPWIGPLRRSTDGGATWRDIGGGIDKVVEHLAVQPGDSNTLLCASRPRRIFRSIDKGDHWELVLQLDDSISGEFTTYVAFCSLNPVDCYAATSKGRFYHSNGNGVEGTWFQPYQPADAPPSGYITCIAVAPDVIYISYGRNNNPPAPIYKSTDGGRHWSKANGLNLDSLPDVTVYSIVIDQRDSEVVYVTTEIGIFRTRNGGDSWKSFDDGMPRVRATGLTLHRSTNTLYASTMGRGVYKRMLSEPELLAVIDDIVAGGVAGFYSDIDKLNHVIVGTSDRDVHHLFWSTGGGGEVGKEVLAQFGTNIVRLAAYYADVDNHNHVTISNNLDNVHELFWQLGPVDQRFIATFTDGSGINFIVGVAGFYSDSDQHQHIIVGMFNGIVHEIFWTTGQVDQRILAGIDSTKVAIAGYYADIDKLNHVIVGARDGKVHHLFWVLGNGQVTEEVLTEFNFNTIVGVAGFYSDIDQHNHVIVSTKDGKVHELFWQLGPVNQGVLTQFGANTIVGVAGFYSDIDQHQHVIVGINDGKVYDLKHTLVRV